MEVLRPVLDSSRDGLFGGMKQKKIGDGNILPGPIFGQHLFLKMFPTSKWAKLNGFEQLTSRAFRIRSRILQPMSSFNFTAFFLKPKKLVNHHLPKCVI